MKRGASRATLLRFLSFSVGSQATDSLPNFDGTPIDALFSRCHRVLVGFAAMQGFSPDAMTVFVN